MRLVHLLFVLLAATALASPAQRHLQLSDERQKDPPLTIPEEELSSALTCPYGDPQLNSTIVLLVHGTGSTGNETWAATYSPALLSDGFVPCWVTMPNRSLADAQISAEFLVHAIHTLSRLSSSHQIAVIAHSQGCLHLPWVLAFFPSTQALVSNAIYLAGDFHGTASGALYCEIPHTLPGNPHIQKGCLPSLWQQMPESKFLSALEAHGGTGSGQLTNGSVTSIYTLTDDVINPEPHTSKLSPCSQDTCANIPIQHPLLLCPPPSPGATPTDHFNILTSAITYALVLDALTNEGPADVKRIFKEGKVAEACVRGVAEGMESGAGEWVRGAMMGVLSVAKGGKEEVGKEPELRDYART